MVTSEDIEKLLAKNDYTDDGEIPPLELSHGSKIDAMMDSKFGGKSLEEMSRKLDQLRLITPKIDIGIGQTDDDENYLPVKRRGAKPLPEKEPQLTKDNQENTEEKENIPDDDDGAFLPVKRREPKAAPKKDTETDSDKEKFKKPMPPKPWKTKKKKIPNEEDPGIVIFPGAEGKTVNGNDASIEPSKNGESSFVEPKPQALPQGAPQDENLQVENKSDAVMNSPSTANENEDEKNENASTVQNDGNLEKQDDFGLGNDDFKSSGEGK